MIVASSAFNKQIALFISASLNFCPASFPFIVDSALFASSKIFSFASEWIAIFFFLKNELHVLVVIVYNHVLNFESRRKSADDLVISCSRIHKLEYDYSYQTKVTLTS